MEKFNGDVNAIEFIKQDYETDFEFDARFLHALFLHNLQHAGVNFHLDDLSLEEWGWIAELKRTILEMQNGSIKQN